MHICARVLGKGYDDGMNDSARQLVFELPHRPALGLEDFLVSKSNEAAVALIDRWPDWPAGAAVIAGRAGSGKSHLANVWRLKSGAEIVRADAFDAARVAELAQHRALVVEDVPAVRDQAAVFHLLNLVREQRLALLVTSPVAPGDLQLTLPDLTSRLKALPLAVIEPPDDALLRAVLVKLFADRQIPVDPQILSYLLLRMERSMDAARTVVAEIDRQALTYQKGVTRAITALALEKLGIVTKVQ